MATNPLPAAMTLDKAPRTARQNRRRHSAAQVITVLSLAALALGVTFMVVELRGNLGYVLPRRAVKVGSMILVAYAVGLSTVLFQTVTANRILTPSIMGFDALYVLLQTVLTFVLGGQVMLTMAVPVKFGIEVLLMLAFSLLLYRWLFTGGGRSLHLMLLVGIVFGTLFRGISALMRRLMEPSEYLILQDLFFASFNRVDGTLLLVAAGAVVLATIPAWRLRREYDVLALGRETAINLGVDHRRQVTLTLVVCSVLVAVSTALVGPITFFGLLVASLAYQLVPRFTHASVLSVAVLLGIISLVGGQLVLERIFDFNSALSIVIEFVGGLVFIGLLLRGSLK